MMRRVSRKTKARADAVRGFRRDLIREVGRCEVCGHDPARAKIGGIGWNLSCHEVANGPSRQAALDKRFALLVVCWRCNSDTLTDKQLWTQARQLAALRRSRPQDYDLAAFNELVGRGPRRITEDEVDAWK